MPNVSLDMLPPGSIVTTHAQSEAEKAARVAEVAEWWNRPQPTQKKHTSHGRPTTLHTEGMDFKMLYARLTSAVSDLIMAENDKDKMVRHPALNRNGYKSIQCADDAIVLASELADALTAAYPRGATKEEKAE
jgi:hypothetical protein